MKILYSNRGPSRTEYTEWHTHSFWQLDYMIDDLGKEAFFESEGVRIKMSTGGGVVIPPYCPHCLTYTRGQIIQPMKFECSDISDDTLRPIGFKHDTFPGLAAHLFEQPQPVLEVEKEIYGHYLMILILTLYQDQLKLQDQSCGVKDSRLVKTVRWIDRNRHKKITLAMLSSRAGLSESQLRRLFQNELHNNPMDYVRSRRIENAKEHLRYSDMNIGQIADTLGFANQHIFSRLFKQQTGISPSQYRREKA